jgi:lysophospholipase L1-like esterase
MAAGIRAAFRTDATSVRLDIVRLDRDVPPVDFVVDGVLHRRVQLQLGANRVDVELPARPTTVEVWLPQFGTVQVTRLAVTGATVAEPLKPRPRWVTYGSSVTHCHSAPGPSQTWPALVARRLDWDLTCLGFAGQCHLDPIAAETICSEPADIVSLCIGANIHGQASLSPRTLPGQLAGFVERIRASHPSVPILLMSPIAAPEREQWMNAVGITLVDMRSTVARVADVLRGLGDDHLHLVDGLEVLGPESTHLLPDGLHPDGDGYQLMADRLAPILSALLPRSPS